MYTKHGLYTQMILIKDFYELENILNKRTLSHRHLVWFTNEDYLFYENVHTKSVKHLVGCRGMYSLSIPTPPTTHTYTPQTHHWPTHCLFTCMPNQNMGRNARRYLACVTRIEIVVNLELAYRQKNTGTAEEHSRFINGC